MNAPSSRLGKYDLVRALGEGAMGVVYEAVDSVIERTVAIKTIRKSDLDPDEAAEHGRRFLIEAKAAGKLNHPNIVGLYDHGEEAGLAYLVMELVRGRELQHYFDEHHAFTLGDIVRLMGELLDALGYSHRRGVIHRDVKPANIFITEDGHVKLGDFGIARIESSTKTRVGAVLGTPSFMAPEQIRGEGADARSDLYAAGVVFFQFLTGRRPFTGTMLSMALKVLSEPAPSPSSIRPGVPVALDAVVARALAKQPADRYQTAADFWRALVQASGLAAPGGGAGGLAADEATEAGFGRSGFGDTGFGRSGFGDTGFGRSGFGHDGAEIGKTAAGNTGGGMGGGARASGPPPDNAEPTVILRRPGPAAPAPATAALPGPTARARPAQAAAAPPSKRVPVKDPAGPPRLATRPAKAAWAGAAAVATILGVGWWALRPAAPPTGPEVRHDSPARADSRPPAPGPAASQLAGPAATPTPVAAPVAAPSASVVLPPVPPPQTAAPPTAAVAPTVPAPPASAPAALAKAAPGLAATPPPPAAKPPPRPLQEARAAAAKPAAEATVNPAPKAAKPGRCSDILQKASLEPLTSEEAAYLRRECQ